jgi:hypothetical protein
MRQNPDITKSASLKIEKAIIPAGTVRVTNILKFMKSKETRKYESEEQ